MRIGIVCPYSWDVPGGVQFHVRDLAEHLTRRGHDVSVLAPADDDTPLPPYVVSAGRAVPVPYNGSVARLNFGFLSAARARRWVHEGDFDVLHIHEPAAPSLALLTCWAARGPIVGTVIGFALRWVGQQHGALWVTGDTVLTRRVRRVATRIQVGTVVLHLGYSMIPFPFITLAVRVVCLEVHSSHYRSRVLTFAHKPHPSLHLKIAVPNTTPTA